MCSANLTGLPAELLNEIVFHLGYEDRVSLASTHRDLHLLRPKEKTLRPEAFCLQSITYTVALPLLAPSRSTQPFSRHWPRPAYRPPGAGPSSVYIAF